MPNSVLPVFGDWWRSAGTRRGDGADIPAGASSTPYDGAAVPIGSKRWSIEFEYSAAAPVNLAIRQNHITAGKEVARQTDVTTYLLAAGTGVGRRIDIELRDSPHPNWLPSLRLIDGAVSFTSVKVYETPVNAGPPVTVWDGAKEVEATVTVWDGAKEVACTVEVFNG
jgi:hypothetical protein